MNKKYKITIILFILFCFLFPTNIVKAGSDIAYIFDDNVLIDSTITDFDDTFNVKDSQYYTGHYNATYSFENDIDGSIPNGWIDVSLGNTEVFVISSFSGHSKVLQLNDSDGSEWCRVTQTFDNTNTNGTIEFWWSTSSIGSDAVSTFLLYETNDIIVHIFMKDDDLFYYDGATKNLKLGFISINTFFHIKVVLNDSANTFDAYINNLLVLDNGGYRNPSVVGIDEIQFLTDVSDNNYQAYFDAIGYSWSIFTPNNLYTFDDLTADTEFTTNIPYQDWIYTESGSNNPVMVRDTTPISNEYLELHYKDGTSHLEHPLYNGTFGTLDLDVRYTETTSTDLTHIYLEDDFGAPAIDITPRNNYLSFFDIGTGSYTPIVWINDNQWYDLTLIWNCISDTYDIYVNDTHFGNYPFFTVVDNLSIFIISMTGVGSERDILIDNVLAGANTFNYTIGNNLIPYLNSTGLKEVDKYEFALDDINSLIPVDTKEGFGWIQTGVENELAVIIQDPNDSNDRVYKLSTDGTGQTVGITNDNFDSNDIFITIDFESELIDMTGNNGTHTIIIESSDSSYIAMLDFRSNGSMNIFQAVDDFWGLQVRDDITTGKNYRIVILVNYELDITFIDLYIDDVYTDSYTVPNFFTGKNGLSQITFLVHSVDYGNLHWNIDNIGIYYNGVSFTPELAYTVYNIGLNWNTQEQNLLFLKANGTFDIGIVEGSYTVEMSMITFRSIRNYYNSLHTINGYDSDTTFTNATFVFTLQNHYFNISTFKIDGVLLKEGVNEYNLEFEHSGVDIDESYFYVVSNRLYFTHTSDDTNLEYIQAIFDINDVNSTNYAFSFRSDMDNNAYGFVRINYTDISNIIQIPYTLTTTRFLLTQNQIVRDIIILITDKDNNIITGLTEGYIYNIELIDVIDISVSVITESLLNMIIPLIIILIPTLLFSQKFGKMVIVPLFILFSLVLTISLIIPYWLFFIIIFPSIIMVFFKSKKEVV